MAVVNSNFKYNSTDPNFARDQYASVAEMKTVPLNYVDRGHISFCVETGLHYEFANEFAENDTAKTTPLFDETTGYWRVYNSGGGSSTCDCNAIPDSTIDNLFAEEDESETTE